MNPYDILGVSPDATRDAINKAFRLLSLRTHPDHGGNPESFKRVQEAFDLIRDEKRRAHFDEFGTAWKPMEPGLNLIQKMMVKAMMESQNPLNWIYSTLVKQKAELEQNKREVEADERKCLASITRMKLTLTEHITEDEKDILIGSAEHVLDQIRRGLTLTQDMLAEVNSSLTFLRKLSLEKEFEKSNASKVKIGSFNQMGGWVKFEMD